MMIDRAVIKCWCWGYAIVLYNGLWYAVKESEDNLLNYTYVQVSFKELIKDIKPKQRSNE